MRRLASAGLDRVDVSPQDESIERGQADFVASAGIWSDVAATRGHQMVADGVLSERARATAEHEYRAWVSSDARAMTMHLDAVEGMVR